MKNILNIRSSIYAILLLALVFISSCKKGFDEINNDPNKPKEVPTSFLLTGAQKGLMDLNSDTWWLGFMGNQLAQYWASNQYTAESRYQFRQQIINTYWIQFYAGGSNDALYDIGGLEELQTIINQVTANPAKYSQYGFPNNQIAAATILKVWEFQNLTDQWGAVPYKQALLGAANTQPAFDSQEDIYNGLFAELDNAISIIDPGESGPAGDAIYGGDMEKWLKFANSLKLRLAIRIADRNPTLASQKINEAASGAFASNADNAVFQYQSGAPNYSMLYFNHDIDARNDFCASNTITDLMNGLNDPRISQYFEPAATTGIFVGEVYGLTEANGAQTEEDDVSQRSAKVLAPDAQGVYMDYAEVKFILAEAAERGFGVGNASSDYAAGITASMDFWGVDGADITAYLAQPSVDYGSAPGTWREKIGKQKWLALYNQGMEGWTEWRRLDFGILQLPADGNLEGNGIPKRITYPKDAQTLNGPNYAAAVSAQGPDALDTRVWWDVQ